MTLDTSSLNRFSESGVPPTINDVAARLVCRRVRCPRSERPARRRAGHPSADPRGRRGARLDAQPPGPGAVGLQGARRRAHDRPATGDPACRRVLPRVHLRPRDRALAPRARAVLQVAEHGDAATYRRLSKEGRVDGVFVTDLQVEDPRPALLTSSACRTWSSAPSARGRPDPTLGVDDAPGVHAAVDHLVGLGHRRIAHVSGPQSMVHGRSAPYGVGARARRRGVAGGLASRPTSPPSPAPRLPARCSTWRSRRQRSSSPTT